MSTDLRLHNKRELAKLTNTKRDFLEKALEFAMLKPAHEYVTGRGMAKLYTLAQTEKAVKMYREHLIEEQQAKEAEKKQREEQRKVVSSAADNHEMKKQLGGVTEQVNSISMDVAETHALTELTHQDVQKLLQQNHHLFKAVNILTAALADQQRSITLHSQHMNELCTRVEQVLDKYKLAEEIQPVPKLHVPEIKQPLRQLEVPPLEKAEKTEVKKAIKQMVVIVGLFNSQQQLIERDFGNEIQLSFFNASNANTRSFNDALKNSSDIIVIDKVFKHISDYREYSRHAKIHHAAGVSSIKSILTALYLKYSEQQETTK